MSRNCLTTFASGVLLAWFAMDVAGQPQAEPTSSASWPQHHGPQRTNISPETGLLKEWPADGPPLVWQVTKCGDGYSGVTIADGLIFTAGNFGKTEMVLAFDLHGQLQWKASSGPAWDSASPGSRCTPTYYEGAVYMLNPQGRLTALDARTGRVRWTVDLVERFAARWGVWGLSENLLIDKGKLYCMPGGEQGRVVALDPQDRRDDLGQYEDRALRGVLLADHHHPPRRAPVGQHDAAIRSRRWTRKPANCSGRCPSFRARRRMH